jgi:toxin FitB
VLIILDTTLLWLLVRGSNHEQVLRARTWAEDRLSRGHTFAVAEINDYETRRELIRRNASAQVDRLDALIARTEFLPIDRPTILFAAKIWAQLRANSQQTASDDALDGDVILGAQAIIRSQRNSLSESVVVATSNIRHLSRICTTPPCTAADWVTIT